MYCPDKKGIIADVTQYINRFNGNIIYIDQYVDRLEKVFFMRVVVENNFSSNSFDSFKNSFNQELGKAYKLKCDFFLEDQIPQLAVFVSKYEHCLYDILSQYQSGKLTCKIHFVLSNHENLKNIAEQFKIPFYHIPILKKNTEKAEAQQLKLLKKYKIDSIVLARYMQILSSNFVNMYPNQIINIHHQDSL